MEFEVITSWDELTVTLHINTGEVPQKSIDKLIRWSQENISTETEFHGTREEQYRGLKQYISHFFETISAHQADGLLFKHKALKNLSVFQYACLRGYDQYISQILSSRDDPHVLVNDVTAASMTALHFAALEGHVKTAETLLSYSADTTLPSRFKQLPIHLSVILPPRAQPETKTKKALIFKLLKQTDPRSEFLPDMSGDTVAHCMAQNGFSDLIQTLVDERSPLLLVTNGVERSVLHLSILNKHPDTTRVLLAVPELLEMGDRDERTPLHYAALYADAPCLKACADLCTNIDEEDSYSRTALLFAASAGHLDSVVFLIDRHADITKQDMNGLNVLHHACLSMNLGLVQWLVKHSSADIDATDKMGRTVLMTLFANHKKITPEIENLALVLLDADIDVSVVDKSGKTVSDYLKALEEVGEAVHPDIYSKTVGYARLTL